MLELFFVVVGPVIAGVEVVEVGRHLRLQLVLDKKGFHTSVEEPRSEAIVSIVKQDSYKG